MGAYYISDDTSNDQMDNNDAMKPQKKKDIDKTETRRHNGKKEPNRANALDNTDKKHDGEEDPISDMMSSSTSKSTCKIISF